jgi:flagellar motility protein MotE (MotC chaperone)
MRSKAAGEILNFMEKEKAAELTTAFSLRKTDEKTTQ